MNNFRFLHMMRQLKRGCSFSTSCQRHNQKLLDSFFAEDIRMKLLNFFNRCKEPDLQCSKYLDNSDAREIVQFRKNHGEFETLSCLLKVPDINISKMHVACSELQSKDLTEVLQNSGSKTYKKIKPYPKMTFEQCQEVESLIAIDVQSDRLTWAKINRNLDVLDWQQTLLFDKSYQIYDHIVYSSKISEFLESLPETSIYVMEKKSHKVTHIRYVKYISNLRILEAVIATMFNSKDLDKVFIIRSQPISNLFHLNVGGERISGKNIIKDIISGKPVVGEDIVVPAYVANNYNRADSTQQEKFADVLLLGLAFYKLVIFGS